MSKILVFKDLSKVNNIKLREIKNLIKSFQILEESYKKEEYKIKIKILYNSEKIKKFLGEKGISFSEPENISVLFYPAFFINEEIQSFNENFFYTDWDKVSIENQTINFILPLEDLEDISKIIKNKDKIEELDIKSLVNKYDIKNYVFALINYQNKKVNIHLKINFNNNKKNKNISYPLIDKNDDDVIKSIIEDFKSKINDFWKEENLVNVLMPLSIQIKFDHSNLKNLNKLRDTLKKIGIINDYNLEEFNINNSTFKIYYYGDPKKLKNELLKFGYQLRNTQGSWQLYSDE
jgi:hypothetical protein